MILKDVKYFKSTSKTLLLFKIFDFLFLLLIVNYYCYSKYFSKKIRYYDFEKLVLFLLIKLAYLFFHFEIYLFLF